MKVDRRWPMKWRVAAAFTVVGAIWGTAWIPTESLSRQLPPLSAGVLRFGLAAIFLGIVAVGLRFRRPEKVRTSGRILIVPAAVLGVTMLGLPYALTVWGAGRVSPGLVALLYGLMPLMVLLFEGDSRDGAISALVLGIGGVAMVVAPGLSFHWSQAGGAGALLGAVASAGFSLVYVRRLYARGRLTGKDLVPFCAIQLVVASAFLLVLAVGTGEGITFRLDETAYLPLAILAIVVSAGTLPVLYWLLGGVSAWRVATLQWVATLVAVGEAASVLHVRPALEGWVGAALIPACIVWIFLRGDDGITGPVTPKITSDPFSPLEASDIQGKSG
jgi:drug/metabolite transporter (DMT)-like permease